MDAWVRKANFALVLEHARHGDLSAFPSHTGKAWCEAAARREIAGVPGNAVQIAQGQLRTATSRR